MRTAKTVNFAGSRYKTACVYSLVRERDLALDTLETWFSHANGATRRWLVTDNDFDPLSGHLASTRWWRICDRRPAKSLAKPALAVPFSRMAFLSPTG